MDTNALVFGHYRDFTLFLLTQYMLFYTNVDIHELT